MFVDDLYLKKDINSFCLDGTATRTATVRASPHWLINNGGSSSRSGSNPSSELSCLTQNTNILFVNNETNSNHTPPSISHYGFPSSSSSSTTTKHHPIMNGNSTLRSSSFDQQQSITTATRNALQISQGLLSTTSSKILQ